MPKKPWFALTLTLVLLLSACSSSNNSSEAISSDGVYVSECGYGYSQKPSSITLTCADGGMYIDAITYIDWNDEKASGNANFYNNNCDPDCASGQLIKTAVSIEISEPITDSSGKMIFSKLVIIAKQNLFNGTKKAEFDIGTQPENSSEFETSPEPAAKVLTPAEATNDLLDRLNSNNDIWRINEAATSAFGQMSHQRLGLFSEPDYVIECNVQWSGTWLFVYSDENAAYDAINSDYFYRTSAYNAEFTYDPQTNLIVVLHTSMGGKKVCLDSAFSQLEYYATD